MERKLSGFSSSQDHLIKKKSVIRKKLLEERNQLNKQWILSQSQAVAAQLRTLNLLKRSKNILVYLSKEQEVQTEAVIKDLFEMGKCLFVPVVDKNSPDLKISQLSGLDIEFQLGPFGIREPVEKFLNFVPSTKIDTVILPGVAFDLFGTRIGFGKGYFDRLLSEISENILKIALAYDFQILPKIPRTREDIPINIIVTESRTITIEKE